MKPGFWVSWRHLGSLKKARFDTAEERAVFVQTWLRNGKPALWATNSRGQRIIRPYGSLLKEVRMGDDDE